MAYWHHSLQWGLSSCGCCCFALSLLCGCVCWSVLYVLVNVFSVGTEPVRWAALNGRLARCCCSRDTAGLGNSKLGEQASHRAATVPFLPDLEYSWANHLTPLSCCAFFCENRYWVAWNNYPLEKTFGYLQLEASGNMLLLNILLFTVIQMSFASKTIFLTTALSIRCCSLRIILGVFPSSA